MASLNVLYDGWPLAHAPNSAAAIHLLTILELSGGAVDAHVALPAEAPAWLPPDAHAHVHPARNEPRGRLRWQQNHLPALADELDCALIHSTANGVPLRAGRPALVSPAAENGETDGGFWGRVGGALGAGGASQAITLYPSDLRDFAPQGARLLPPVAHPAFYSKADGIPASAGLAVYPGEFILAHVPGDAHTLRKVMDTWSWSAKALAHSHPLVFAHLHPEGRASVERLARQYEVSDSVQYLPALSPNDLAAVYQRCTAVYHPTVPSPWGDAVRLGIAAGKPVVSYAQAEMAAMMGPAGFLVADEGARKLGGQVIAITVKHNIAADLERSARQHAAGWDGAVFAEALLSVYREAATPG
jgi:hypothetical protein